MCRRGRGRVGPPGEQHIAEQSHLLQSTSSLCHYTSIKQARARKVDLRVSSISPGIVETEFYQASRAGDAEGAQKFYSQAKFLQVCSSTL